MKPRRVVLAIETITDIPLTELRKIKALRVILPENSAGQQFKIDQMQVNVVDRRPED